MRTLRVLPRGTALVANLEAMEAQKVGADQVVRALQTENQEVPAGAIVALGDTLFPAATLREGLAADRDPAAHFLIRLRMWHPLLAVTLSVYVLSVIWQSDATDVAAVKTPARLAQWLIMGQVALGVVNIVFLAPLALQMLHLAVSNLLWVALVWLWLAARGPEGPRLR